MKNSEKKPELRTTLASLSPYFGRAMLFTVVANMLSLAPVGYMKDVYGPVINSRSLYTLGMVTLLLIGLLLVSGLLEWIRGKVLISASLHFNEKLSDRVLQASFDAHLANRSQGSGQALLDLRTIRAFIASPTMGALMDAPVSLLFLVIVFFMHPVMGLTAFVIGLMLVIVGVLNERRIHPLVRESQQGTAAAQMFIASSTRNAQVAQAMGMMGKLIQRWFEPRSAALRAQTLVAEAQGVSASLSKFLLLAQGSLVLAVGCVLTLMGELPPHGGSMIIASILGGRAIQPLAKLISSWKQVSVARDACGRLEEFLAENPVPKQRVQLPPPTGNLSVEEVTARAPGSKAVVLSNVSLDIKAGVSLGVMGPSGSGKSSLARLLVGVWTPVVGTVRLDGSDVHAWDREQLGPHLGYLPQDIELFEGTIAENIARFGEVDRSKVIEASRQVGLHEMIEALPDRYDTLIGADTGLLSGGQRQRIGLARAIYGGPKLVVLDEPNSNLDQEGERALYNTLEHLKRQGTTVVIISHRKGILPYVDRLLILKAGRPKMYGPRDMVLDKLAGKDVPTISPQQAARQKSHA